MYDNNSLLNIPTSSHIPLSSNMSQELNTWDPEQYNKAAGFVARSFGQSVLQDLKPEPNQIILDLGCGDGVLTKEIASSGANVVGVDFSPQMIQEAQEKYGLNAFVMDGQHLTFDSQFDVVFSNAALHWMHNMDNVIAGVRRALKPNGRFLAECGGLGNIASIVTACLAVLNKYGIDGKSKIPWTFLSPSDWEAKLTAAGFRVKSITLTSKQQFLPDGIVGWLKTFGDNLFDEIEESKRLGAMQEVEDLLAWSLKDSEGRFVGDYMRVRFDAVLDSK